MTNRQNFRIDIENSIQNCKRFIYPVLRLMYGNAAEILSLEENEGDLARRLDYAGNDIAVITDDVITGINSRCHKWSDYPKTFTIRKTRRGEPSEFYRIKKNIQQDGLTPKFFAQCYLKDDSAVVGIIKTKKLFEFIENDSRVATRRNGDVEFFSVEWQYLKDLMKTFTVKGADVNQLK